MAVLARMSASGMDAATYDQISSRLLPLVKQAPGFKLHVAYPTSEGFAVAEIWETKEQHEKFFNEHVKPNVPADVNPDVVELHTLVTP